MLALGVLERMSGPAPCLIKENVAVPPIMLPLAMTPGGSPGTADALPMFVVNTE